MRNQEIARVYLNGRGSNKLVPTGPGRALKFLGGVAYVRDERDMPWAFGIDGAQVEMQDEYLERLHGWLAKYNERTPPLAKLVILGPLAEKIDIGPPPMYAITAKQPVAMGAKSK